MWTGIILFFFSFFGLIALFSMKGAEENGKEVRLLAFLRNKGDDAVRLKIEKIETFFREDARVVTSRGLNWLRAKCAETEIMFLKVTQRAIYRVHERLLRRKARISNGNSGVSAHLKSVLEYKEEVKEEKK